MILPTFNGKHLQYINFSKHEVNGEEENTRVDVVSSLSLPNLLQPIKFVHAKSDGRSFIPVNHQQTWRPNKIRYMYLNS